MPPAMSLRPAFSSPIPRLIVLRATPLASETAVTPPRPSDKASLAANNRRPRSSRNGSILRNRVRRLSTSTTTPRYRCPSYSHNNIVILSLRCWRPSDSLISRQILRVRVPLDARPLRGAESGACGDRFQIAFACCGAIGRQTWWVRWLMFFWIGLSVFDTAMSQLTPKSIQDAVPNVYEIVAAILPGFSWQEWAIVGLFILLMGTLEFAFRQQRKHSRTDAIMATSDLPNVAIPILNGVVWIR